MIAQAQLLGSVDPKVFEDLPDAFGEAAEKNSWQWEPAALWAILKRADSRTA